MGGPRADLVDALRKPLGAVFGAAVDTREFGIDLEQFYDDGRGQYNSTEILLHVKNRYEGFTGGGVVKTLAIIPHDLFIPILTYVFGEAEVGGNVAVVSYYRLAPERYGLPGDPRLLMNRFLKEAVHELGHVHSLIHCSTQECVMHSSSYVEDIDLKGHVFCKHCADALAAR
jgi:archaemetzincin